MQRNPPEIKKVIRKEDGFVCAHPKCDIPYLEYHHFDPPWSERNHNNPKGIIALCPLHHRQADGGMFSIDQLRDWKKSSKKKFGAVKSSLEWMKNKLGAKLGGSLSIDDEYSLMIQNHPIIWFNHVDNYALLNINLYNNEGRLILKMTDNDWEVQTDVLSDIECIPSGKRIKISFKNNDNLVLDFKDYQNVKDFLEKNKIFSSNEHTLNRYFPLSIVEISGSLFGGQLKLDPNRVNIGGVMLQGFISRNNKVGFHLK